MLMRKLLQPQRCFKRIDLTSKKLNYKGFSSLSSNEYTQFPRESEGNVYSVNWSLTEDGVVPTGDAYRNARLPILTTRLAKKVDAGKVELDQPKYAGTCTVVEAGDSMSHDAFNDLIASHQSFLSTASELFVEDAGAGSAASSRVGVRVVTNSPAAALIVRTLMIPTPPRTADHRARFNGWNLDERWIEPEMVWNGVSYDICEVPTTSLPGQRPIVALFGGPGDKAAVQFVERSGSIVGANVVVGGDAPVKGLVDAITHAAVVLVNAQYQNAIALPSVSVTSGSETAVVIGADESVVEAAMAKNVLHGAYGNVMSVEGVSALFNGIIGAPAKSLGIVPTVVVGGKAAVALAPLNLAFPAKRIVFYEKGGKSSSISEEEAVKKIVAMTDESKAAVAAALVKGAKLSITGSATEAIAI